MIIEELVEEVRNAFAASDNLTLSRGEVVAVAESELRAGQALGFLAARDRLFFDPKDETYSLCEGAEEPVGMDVRWTAAICWVTDGYTATLEELRAECPSADDFDIGFALGCLVVRVNLQEIERNGVTRWIC